VGEPTPAPALKGNDQPQSHEAGRPAKAPDSGPQPTPAKPKQQEKAGGTDSGESPAVLYDKLVPVFHQRVRQN
jgi:hypothetical protein